MITTDEIIAMARKHLATASPSQRESAELALHDAELLYRKDDLYLAAERALTSLAYSIGVFHVDYNDALDFVRDLRTANQAEY